jgi:type IV secretory pathway VirB2 component (pilin)
MNQKQITASAHGDKQSEMMVNAKAAAVIAVFALGMAYGPAALAYNLPWEDQLCQFFRSISGRTAAAVAGIIIVLTGLGFAAGEAKGWFKTGLGIICGLAIAFGAVQMVMMFNPQAMC